MAKGLGKKVKVNGQNGTIVGARNNVGGGAQEWKVKLADGSESWYSDSQVSTR